MLNPFILIPLLFAPQTPQPKLRVVTTRNQQVARIDYESEAEKKLRDMLKPFPKTAKLVWCQEEPQNMGAWTFVEPRLRTMFCREIAYAGRDASA